MTEQTTDIGRRNQVFNDSVIVGIGIIASLVLLFSSLWGAVKLLAIIVFLLATVIKYTVVNEGTAKIIVRLGKFKKALLQWEGFVLDSSWQVGKGSGFYPLGGLRIVGIRLLDEVFEYKIRWHDTHLIEDGKEDIRFHEDTIDYIPVRPDVYWSKIVAAETKAEVERVPVDVEFLITMKVVNPYRVIFVAPYNWVENVVSNLNSIFRGYVGDSTLDVLIAKKGKDSILDELKDSVFITTTTSEWGIQIDAIRIRDLGLPSDYQKAAAAKREQEMVAAGRAAETVGSVLEMMAQSYGKTVAEIREEISKNDPLKAKFLEMAVDLVKRKMAIEGESFVDIRLQGAEGQSLDGLAGVILAALAANKRMPLGKGGDDQTGGSEKKEAKEQPKKEEKGEGKGQYTKYLQSLKN